MADIHRREGGPRRLPKKTLDQRFDEVSEAIAEQRDFTLFCFDKLRKEMVTRFDRVDQRFDGIDQRLGGVDQRVDGIEQRLGGIDQRLDTMNGQFKVVAARFEGVDQRLDKHEVLLTEILGEVRALSRRA